MNESKVWQIAKKLPKKFIKEHQVINSLMLQILYNRNIFNLKDKKEKINRKIDYFLEPNYEKLHDPFLLKDIKKAVLRIKKAVNKKENVAIFGDYDVDGVTASAVLYETFKFLGIKPEIYIPHRDKEGYGLNEEAVKSLAKKNISLIITVDCGVLNLTEVLLAKKLGVDIVITDHHEPADILPKAEAVINPKIKNNKYPFRELAGVGVAFKLAQALILDSKIKEGDNFIKWLLDLVAIGSIGDMVPLIDENRVLVRYGSIVFNKTKRLGLKELKGKATNNGIKTIDFSISPKLNAAGRMDHANWAFQLLVSESKVEAFQLVNKIERLNNDRKILTDGIVQAARKEIEPVLPEEKIIIVANKDWSASVSGIVASRLVDLYNLPALVIERKGKYSKGSARSPKEIDIIKVLRQTSHIFTKLGGHKNAAGFTYETKNHNLLVEKLIKLAGEIKTKVQEKKIAIDAEIEFENIDYDFFSQFKKLEPFGINNPEPVFLLRNLRLINKKRVGSNHLKFWFAKNGKKREAIGFGKSYLDNDFLINDKLDVIFRLRENEYRGIKSIQFEVLDIRK